MRSNMPFSHYRLATGDGIDPIKGPFEMWGSGVRTAQRSRRVTGSNAHEGAGVGTLCYCIARVQYCRGATAPLKAAAAGNRVIRYMVARLGPRTRAGPLALGPFEPQTGAGRPANIAFVLSAGCYIHRGQLSPGRGFEVVSHGFNKGSLDHRDHWTGWCSARRTPPFKRLHRAWREAAVVVDQHRPCRPFVS